MAEYEWHDLVGNLGVIIILVTYLAVQIDRIDVTGIRYSILNGIGAVMIIFSLMVEFNLSAIVMEFAWLLISIFGIARRLYLNRVPNEGD